MFAKRVHQRARPPDKHAAVPEVAPGGDKLFGALGIRLLSETPYATHAAAYILPGFDVSIAGFGAIGLDAHHHDAGRLIGEFDAALEHLTEAIFVGNHMIG